MVIIAEFFKKNIKKKENFLIKLSFSLLCFMRLEKKVIFITTRPAIRPNRKRICFDTSICKKYIFNKRLSRRLDHAA